jgi:hypothetical protein
MRKNASTRGTTINAVMKRKAFRMGFEDYHAGIWRGDDPIALDVKGSTWTYERGRLFAAALPRARWSAIKQGNSIDPMARKAYLKLQKERVII